MNGKSRVLRAGEYLVGRATRYLPPSSREQRHQEWSAELPVILHDPAVRPAARRAARMLWFAADTLRGAAIARYTAAGHHAHRDADGKARDLVTRQGLTSLATLPVLLGLTVYIIYPGPSGGITYDVLFLALPVVILLSHLVSREPVTLRGNWYAWSMLTWGTGQLLHGLAHRFSWGHPLLFNVIYYAGGAILVAAIVIPVTGWARSAHMRFRNVRP